MSRNVRDDQESLHIFCFAHTTLPYLRVIEIYKIMDALLFLNLLHASNEASKDGFSSTGSHVKEVAFKLKSI